MTSGFGRRSLLSSESHSLTIKKANEKTLLVFRRVAIFGSVVIKKTKIIQYSRE